MALSEDEKEIKLQAFIEAYGTEEFTYSVRDLPDLLEVADPDDPVNIEDLPTRPLPGKVVTHMFDVNMGVPGNIDEEQIGRAMREDNFDQLPDVIRPRVPLPEGAVLQWVFQRTPDETVNVLKHFIFKGRTKTADARQLVTGVARAPLWCDNPWGGKKGYQAFIDNIPGTHIKYAVLKRKKTKEDGAGAWNPTPEEVARGIQFINDNIPLANDQLQQLAWIITHVKNDSDIRGWPMGIVQRAAEAKAKANSAVDAESFFPLCVFDLHPVIVDKILPLIVPLCSTFGVLLLGNPGVGKTPLAMILSMAVGRMHCRRRGINKQPGWRRCKQFDGFRNKPGEVQEAIILDDADLSAINVEDVKSFGDVGEANVCDARYSPAKMAKNSLHLLLNNAWDADKEPTPLQDGPISHEEFMGMVGKTFGYVSAPHLMAVFKRYVTLIGGKNAVYVRPPGSEPDVPVHAFVEGGVAQDWLVDPGNKHVYSMWKKGEKVTYDGFDAAQRREQDYLDNLMQASARMTPTEIVAQWTQSMQPAPPGTGAAAEQPASAEPSHPEPALRVRADADGVYRFPVPQAGRGATVRGRFNFPSAASGSTDRQGKRAPVPEPEPARPAKFKRELSAASSALPAAGLAMDLDSDGQGNEEEENAPQPESAQVVQVKQEQPDAGRPAFTPPEVELVMDSQDEQEMEDELDQMLFNAREQHAMP